MARLPLCVVAGFFNALDVHRHLRYDVLANPTPHLEIHVAIKKVIVLSDTHCGSTYGILPPGVELQEENAVQLNPLQEYLWDCWQDWTKSGGWLDQVTEGQDFAVIVNGDATEGFHHGSKEVVGTYDSDHTEIAYQLFKPLAEKAAAMFFVEGTECHTKTGEHHLAKALQAVAPKGSRVLHAHKTLRIKFHDCLCLFQHHISTTKRVYLEASQLSIELRNGQLEALRSGKEVHKVLGAAHRHRFGTYHAGDSCSFVSAPWQGVTRFGRKVVPAAFVEPGVVCLDWEGKERGEKPFIHECLYDAPEPEIVAL